MTGTIERRTPRQTTTLFGHEAAEQAFLSAWNSGRMHHAWLIGGPRGIGKATLAFRIARFVLAADEVAPLFGGGAPKGDRLGIPDDHPVSRQVDNGSHPDLLTVERTINPQSGKLRSEISVDDVRQVPSFLALTTAAGTWRVVVVDAADEMNRSAANALLKRLEEPPPHTLFLLVAHHPGRLLPTIRSRCRTLTLSALGEDLLITLMSDLAPGVSGDDARVIARLADGSIGRALAVADAGGLELHRDLVKLLAPAAALDIKGVHALAGRVARSGAEASFELLGQLLDRWLSRTILRMARGNAPPDEAEGEESAAPMWHRRSNLANWLEVWEKVARLFSEARRVNLDRKQVVVNAFLALHAAVNG